MGHLKNEAQVEFSELMEKFRALGKNQADVAKLIRATRPTITKYLSGELTPIPLRLEAARAHLEKLMHCEPVETDNVAEQIAFLRREAPGHFAAAKATIEALHDQAVASSASAGAGAKLLAKGAASELSYKKSKRRRSRATDAPSAPVSAPAPAAAKD